eukprot:6178575-Pleurochrysis_carterae.AAC.8
MTTSFTSRSVATPMMRFDKIMVKIAASSMCGMFSGSMAFFNWSSRWLCCACLASNEYPSTQ